LTKLAFAAEVDYNNWGDPVLDAMKEVQANETWARSMGAAAKHLAAEILHPDNVARYSPSTTTACLEHLQACQKLPQFEVGA